MKPTPTQVTAEIVALKRAIKFVPSRTAFGQSNIEYIKTQIAALEGEIDTDSDEFYEQDDRSQMAANDAIDWMNGDSEEAPSVGWEIFNKEGGK
jgi:hypothetical protein